MNYAVIGLGFGDEGKGMVTDYLCSQDPNSVVVRFSGGHQAGHTVCVGDKRHVFSNFGSGSLRGIPTYWSPRCTIDPVGIMKEYSVLIDKGVKPVLYIDKDCPVVTPFDIEQNILTNKKTQHGTCGVGFGATLAREDSFYSLLASDLFFPTVVDIKLGLIKKFYGHKRDISLDGFLADTEKLLQTADIKITSGIPYFLSDRNFIYEGSQGILLDQNIGFFPHVTRSNTGTKNLPIGMTHDDELFLVTRAYQTRHGNGVMTNENIPHNIKADVRETNVKNKHQGVFRKTLLDIDLLQYGISRDYNLSHWHNRTLVITCLDHIEDEYRFTYKGEIINCNHEDDFIRKISGLLGRERVLVSRTPYSDSISEYSD